MRRYVVMDKEGPTPAEFDRKADALALVEQANRDFPENLHRVWDRNTQEVVTK